MNAEAEYNRVVAENIIKNFAKRNIEGFYCDTKEEALKTLLELIPEKSVISWGGSQTIKEVGIVDALKNGDYSVIDSAEATSAQEVQEIYRKAFSSDFYLASSNAVTNDGKLVNVDGTGNRVSAMIFGPKNVILVVGMNKVTSTEAEALVRVRNKAAAMNALRLSKNTPCSKTGVCQECLSDNCICCNIVVTRYSKIKARLKVILVGETLGY